MKNYAIPLICLLCCSWQITIAQVPTTMGENFQVNAFYIGVQEAPAFAVNAAGRSVIFNCDNAVPFTQTAPSATQFRTAEIVPITAQHALSLAPNPAHHHLGLRLESPTEATARLQILNLEGKTLHWQSLPLVEGRNDQQIGISTLPAGMYILVVRMGPDQQRVKFVKPGNSGHV